VEYSKKEIETWGMVFNRLRPLQVDHGVSQFNKIFPLLQQNCGYSAENVPQLQDVSDFLKGLFIVLDNDVKL
jgi:phenylalanine-4-hydroxylase